jgi:hypothetical protein
MKTILLYLTFFSFGASALLRPAKDVENMTCVPTASTEANLKRVSLATQPNGRMRARVTVAAPNSPTETYSYIVRLLPPEPRRIGGAVIYRAALGRFELSISPIGEKGFSSSLSLRVPKKANLNPPSAHLSYKDLFCTLL